MTLAFGPAEKCTLALVGIVIIATVSGNDILKGLLMGAMGFVFAFLGPDPMSGALRTPFANGLDMTYTLIGLYGVSQVFSELENYFSSLGIGTLIGAIPGTGCLEGVFAPEVEKNAVTGGALVPALSLGIPGDAATAVLIGALFSGGFGFDFRTNSSLIFPMSSKKYFK